MGKINIRELYEFRISQLKLKNVAGPDLEMPKDFMEIGTLTNIRIQKVIVLGRTFVARIDRLIKEYDEAMLEYDGQKRRNIFAELNLTKTLLSLSTAEVETYFAEEYPDYKSTEIDIFKDWRLGYPEDILGKEDWHDCGSESDEYDETDLAFENIFLIEQEEVEDGDELVGQLEVLEEPEDSEDLGALEDFLDIMNRKEGESPN